MDVDRLAIMVRMNIQKVLDMKDKKRFVEWASEFFLPVKKGSGSILLKNTSDSFTLATLSLHYFGIGVLEKVCEKLISNSLAEHFSPEIENIIYLLDSFSTREAPFIVKSFSDLDVERLEPEQVVNEAYSPEALNFVICVPFFSFSAFQEHEHKRALGISYLPLVSLTPPTLLRVLRRQVVLMATVAASSLNLFFPETSLLKKKTQGDPNGHERLELESFPVGRLYQAMATTRVSEINGNVESPEDHKWWFELCESIAESVVKLPVVAGKKENGGGGYVREVLVPQRYNPAQTYSVNLKNKKGGVTATSMVFEEVFDDEQQRREDEEERERQRKIPLKQKKRAPISIEYENGDALPSSRNNSSLPPRIESDDISEALFEERKRPQQSYSANHSWIDDINENGNNISTDFKNQSFKRKTGEASQYQLDMESQHRTKIGKISEKVRQKLGMPRALDTRRLRFLGLLTPCLEAYFDEGTMKNEERQVVFSTFAYFAESEAELKSMASPFTSQVEDREKFFGQHLAGFAKKSFLYSCSRIKKNNLCPVKDDMTKLREKCGSSCAPAMVLTKKLNNCF